LSKGPWPEESPPEPEGKPHVPEGKPPCPPKGGSGTQMAPLPPERGFWDSDNFRCFAEIAMGPTEG